MRCRILACLFVCAFAVGFGGCGKSDDGQSAPIAREELPAEYARAYCRVLEVCCGEAAHSFDAADCHQGAEADIKTTFARIDPDKTAYDSQAAGDCLAPYRSIGSCDQAPDFEDVPACERLFVGLLSPGQPCADDDECKAGPGESANCYGSADGTSVCRVSKRVTQARGKLGSACSETCDGASCDHLVSMPLPGEPAPEPSAGDSVACFRSDNLYCAFDTGTCETPSAIGEPCFGDRSCAGSAFCSVDTMICTAARALGEVCQSVSECGSADCVFTGELETGTCGTRTRTVSQTDCSYFGP